MKSIPLRTGSIIKDRNGSALLLTLLVVSLLLVLVLSFVVFVRLQLREVTNGQNLRIARQNARLGMQMAVSQLQKYAGADQRVTAPATTVYPQKDFDELYDADADEGSSEMFSLYRSNAGTSSSRSYLSQVATYTTPAERQNWEADLADWWNASGRNPHWIGVFNSARRVDRATNPASPVELDPQYYEVDPATLHGEPQRNQLPVWLISGNEMLNFDPLTDSSYPADYLTPDQVLPDPETDGSNSVWMVGEGSARLAADSVDGLDGRVKAPRQVIGGGHYAYWVSDESLKANFAVREPDEYATSSPGTVEYRNRLQVPQRVGWERMEGFADVFDADPSMDVNDPDFAKVVSQSQIGLVDPGFNEPVKANFHHVTSTSQSLLTDTSLGGLKKDLTRYLEDGTGLGDDDPIADPNRYNVNDPRFATYGGTNSGFPHNSAVALDGVPTWGQLRSWYQNEATGAGAGTINPNPDSGTTPVIVHVHFQSGVSYDASTQMMRMHWAPLVMLWNPFDVGLNNETYDIDLGLMIPLDNLLIVNEDMAQHSNLAERAALDPEAGWQEWVISAAQPNGPGGKPLLKAESDPNDGQVTISEVTTFGTYEIFKVVFKRPDSRDTERNTPPDGDTDDRYMVKLEGDPDAFNNGGGPWVYDTTALNATSDAFGRIYYATKPGQSADMYHSRGWAGSYYANSWGLLGNKSKAFTTVNPHDASGSSPEYSMPVDRPFPLRITTGFEPGEVKVFTLATETEWTTVNRMTMVNDYDPDTPEFFWMNLVEIVEGPSSSESAGLRWTGAPRNAYTQGAPSVKMTIGSQVFFETEKFGAAGDSRSMVLGKKYADFHPFNYIKSGTPPNSNPDAWDGDKDGDGNYNKDESSPRFVKFWRPLYDSDNFYKELLTQTANDTDASNWSFGENYVAPFKNHAELGSQNFDALHKFFPVFSRYNLGAQSFVEHPFTEQTRGAHGVNDVHPDVNGGAKGAGLTRNFYQQGSSGEIPWDSNQVLAGEKGFVLTSRGDDGTGLIRGLTHVAIRNAKRADSEILSIGQFQQVNLSPYFWQPSFPIGNSDASPYVDREGVAGIHSRVMGYDYYSPHFTAGARPNNARPTIGNPLVIPSSLLNPGVNTVQEDDTILFNGTINPWRRRHRSYFGGNTMVDMSFLLNENIWDHYYLSTMMNTPADLGDSLPNARLRFNENAASASNLLDFDITAAYLNTTGALNVNSTSVEAWKALLTSFRNLKLGDGSGENPDNTVPVTRTLTPIADSITFDFDTRDNFEIGAVTIQKDYSQVLSGFRYLDDEMIQTLAERIVDEVRLRGPFYSMSDFINRRLTPPAGSRDPGSVWYDARTNGRTGSWMNSSYNPFPGLQGLNGALQRALNLSGINGGVNHPDLGDDGSGTGTSEDMVYTVRIRNGGGYSNTGIGKSANSSRGGSSPEEDGFKHSVDPAMKSHLDSEHAAGAPAGEAGQLLQGVPGFVTQGDLLAMIGPALTARGDTFLIRAYGDAAGNGDADARAWLEAVVQRIPEPVNAAGNSGTDAWRPVNSFGRRFKVVSVRWLTPEEI